MFAPNAEIGEKIEAEIGEAIDKASREEIG
jgi:hypothetical protein